MKTSTKALLTTIGLFSMFVLLTASQYPMNQLMIWADGTCHTAVNWSGASLQVGGANVLTANQSISLSGDATGSGTTSIAATVSGIRGVPVSPTAPSTAQMLVDTGSAWAPVSISGDATVDSTGKFTVTKTNGASFAASATSDATNATNIGSGTLNIARFPALTAGDIWYGNSSNAATAGAPSGDLSVDSANHWIVTKTNGTSFGTAATATLQSIDGSAISTVDNALCQGRLTPTSGTAVTTSDVTGATTVYWTPYKGDCIALYTGSAWQLFTFTETSLSLSGFTASTPYDIWAYNNSGTLALDKTAWTNATTRATALATQNGVYVKTGATGYRYLGTIYINSTGGQTDDSVTHRYVYNYYNQKPRRVYVSDGNSHSYTTASWEAYDNSTTATKVEFMVGVQDDPIYVNFAARITASNGSYVSWNADGTTNASYITPAPYFTTNSATGFSSTFPAAAGYHYLLGLEYGNTGTTFVAFTFDFKVIQ